MYAIGGKLDGEVFNFAESYDSANNIWSEIAPLPQKIAHCASVSYQGKLYVIGGQLKDGQIVNSVFR